MNETSTPHFSGSIAYSAVLGQVLVRKRQTAGGLHQKALADSLGITQSAYSRLENGHSAMSLGQLRVVAEALRCRPGDLLVETDRYVDVLKAQGVTISDEKKVTGGELLIGLGILAAILASSG